MGVNTSCKMMQLFGAALLLLLAVPALSASPTQQQQKKRPGYLVGIGRSDVTGPAAEVNLMGYALMNQTARGIHTRQFARAYVFADPSSQKRFMLVVVDQAMIAQRLTLRVVQRLQAAYGEQLYNSENVMITATHTHSAVGGFHTNFLYHITSWGFVKQSFDALLDGITEACHAAHADLRPAHLSWSKGLLLDANKQRSATAYLANPEAERGMYQFDVDKDMTLLRIRGDDGRGRGLISWFPVHPVSMNNTNRLLSSDNKGVAQQWVEKRWAPHREDLEPGFTAAFAQTNTGDVTPNVLGTFCLNSNLPCDAATSTCNGTNQLCVGRGPAWPDDISSTEIIGERQATKAQELWLGAGHDISGPIDYRHTYVDISNMEVAASNFTRAGHTCLGAMGYSFAAGTTDGPGAKGFFQTDTHKGSSNWSPLAYLINAVARSVPSPGQKQCQGVKPVLLNVGEATTPYSWVPHVTEVALLRLGNLVIICLPGEFTTMAGRRLRRAVASVLTPAWGDKGFKLVLMSYTNTYASYVTTFEEYQVQRYEGGSTLYGPHTLDAYIQVSMQLARSLVESTPVKSAAPPVEFEGKLISLLPPVVFDTVPLPYKFGDVVQQPKAAYRPGETAQVVFWSANPRNNLRRGGTFLEVQQKDPGSGQWQVRYTDDDWSTKFLWDRPKGKLPSESTATVQWQIPKWEVPGIYRIKVFGDAKTLFGGVMPFTGMSNEFTVSV